MTDITEYVIQRYKMAFCFNCEKTRHLVSIESYLRVLAEVAQTFDSIAQPLNAHIASIRRETQKFHPVFHYMCLPCANDMIDKDIQSVPGLQETV